MLRSHQRPELLTLCLVSLTTFSIYMNKFNFCTLLIPKGCPIIRGSEQPHSSRCLPQGFRTGRAEGSVKRFLLRDTTNPKVGSPSPLPSASPRGTFDVGERHDPMIGADVITGGALWRGGAVASAGWLNQQRSFHVRLMLLFIIRNHMSSLVSFHRKEGREERDHEPDLN